MSFAATLPDRPLTERERAAFEKLQGSCGGPGPKDHKPELEDAHYRPGQRKRFKVELRWCWLCGAVHRS